MRTLNDVPSQGPSEAAAKLTQEKLNWMIEVAAPFTLKMTSDLSGATGPAEHVRRGAGGIGRRVDVGLPEIGDAVIEPRKGLWRQACSTAPLIIS
jgi:hypothetical protein